MNGLDIILIKAFQHLVYNLFFPCTFIVWKDNYRRLMTHRAAYSLRNDYLRGREIGKNCIFTIYKIGILIKDIYCRDMIDTLLIEVVIYTGSILSVRMNAVLTKNFTLLNSLTESNSTFLIQFLENKMDICILTVGKEFKTLTTKEEPGIL